VYGRLKPQVRIEQASAEVADIARTLAKTYPRTNEGRSAGLVNGVGLFPEQRARLKIFLGLMLGAVGLLLAITCGNVANLLLARAAARRREIAVRLALGADRAILVRQLLTESLLLCLIAALLGAFLAPWTVQALLGLLPPGDSAFQAPVRTDLSVLSFTLLLSVVTGLLFGLAPALAATRTDIAHVIKGGMAAMNPGRSRFRVQNVLVVAQVAFSLVLLIGAGLLLRTMLHIMSMDLGFQPKRVLLASMDLSSGGYTEERARLFYPQIVEQVSSIPGVERASLSKTTRRGWGDRSIFTKAEPPQDEAAP
jgi:putative ABC transport system permease protein